MLIKETQKSLLDFLMQLMPEDFQGTFQVRGRPNVSSKASKALFSLWKDESNKADSKQALLRPVTCSVEDVNLMQREGLVKPIGNKLEITSKGSEIIKTIILGDEKSSFEDDGKIIDYATAHANTKPKMLKKSNRFASTDAQNWYKRMK